MSLLLSVSFATADRALASSAVQPLVRAIFFHADWCPNCRVIVPALDRAKRDTAMLPVQFITLDFTTPQSWDQAIEIAVQNDIVSTYNAYAGTTGLVVLVAADTGERIDCINRTFTRSAMVQSFENAVTRVQTTQPGMRDTGSIICPPGRVAP